ncbi:MULTISPECIES: cytochrome P450 [Streptomyces]|uniref:Cytochrome P450 n=1 Tax=Streptomyces solicathayae TaxID=3081768 RepID=A0ABZ0LNL2_9ACTN|nr:cytochrome P450 [Streptomyces sp. HUAS YS2]WOX21085.1 cytochrome P450 [Streptomyces sp. HUAS YS2]
MRSQPAVPVPPPGCPAHDSGGRVPLHGPEFADDPQAYYAFLRHQGPTAPVEIAPGVEATLVTDYATARQLLQNSGALLSKDSRRWRDLGEGRIPPDSPVVPVLGYQPHCVFADGAEHHRLRQAITDSMNRVDPARLNRATEQISDYLIAQFSTRGSADLLGDYAGQVPLLVFNEIFGCPAEIGDRIVYGVTGMFDGVKARKAIEVLHGAVGDLVALKRAVPGDDVTSWLMQHPAALNDGELLNELCVLFVTANEPLRNLMGNTLHRLLTLDRRARMNVRIDDAINDTLWVNPPIQNLAAHYPVDDMTFAGRQFRKGDLILISFAAANTDPAITAAREEPGNRSHLGWSAGPHACPSKEPARQITVTAIENLLSQIPDVELAVPEASLTWRPGPFNRALAALPARFTPVAAQPMRRPAPQAAPAPTPAGHKAEHSGLWSQFLTWLKG